MLYKGDGTSTSMYIFLPESTPNAIDELLNKLTPPILDNLFNRNLSLSVQITLPKISFEKTSKLAPVC